MDCLVNKKGMNKMNFTNSPLINYVKRSPNHSGLRNHEIDTITIHCMAGNLSVETCGEIFVDPARRASSNYGIDGKGRIGLYVDEANRSWCSSSASNDNRAVTIEVANIEAKEPYRITAAAYNALIKLCADICRRNNIKKLLWRGDKSLIGQVDKQNMTVHRWFTSKKNCPGDYLYSIHGQIASDVNKLLNGEPLEEEVEEEMTQDQFDEMFKKSMNKYRKDLQDNDSSKYSKEGREWAEKIGLIAGGAPLPNGEANFMWEDFLTREQMVTLLYRLKNIEGFKK